MTTPNAAPRDTKDHQPATRRRAARRQPVRAPTALGPPAATCPSAGLPAPSPQMVRAARGYLAARYATGVDAVLWEAIQHPLPDLDAIDAVNAASRHAQQGAGDQPEPMTVAAALVVLGAARLEMDQTEARLLNTAQASGVSWEQIAAALNLGVEAAEERYRQLKPRLDEPVADVVPPRLGDRATHRPRAATGQRSPTCPPVTGDLPAVWDEPEDDPWGRR